MRLLTKLVVRWELTQLTKAGAFAVYKEEAAGRIAQHLTPQSESGFVVQEPDTTSSTRLRLKSQAFVGLEGACSHDTLDISP